MDFDTWSNLTWSFKSYVFINVLHEPEQQMYKEHEDPSALDVTSYPSKGSHVWADKSAEDVFFCASSKASYTRFAPASNFF